VAVPNKPNEANCKKIYWYYLYYSGLSGPDYSFYPRLMAHIDWAVNLRSAISAGGQALPLSEE